MTTKIKISNHGPKPVTVQGGTTGAPETINVHEHRDVYVTDGHPLTITEVEGPAPNLAGGPGEPHPHS